jgi:hypothetical protein
MVFRGSLLAATVSVLPLAVAIGEAGGQALGNPEPTPAEMAKAIAHAIDANALKMPNAPIAFESATSHDNFVEVHYAAKDARLFPHNKAEGEKRRLGQTGYFCFDRRIQLFRKNGVVIHQVLAAPDDSAPFEFTIDQSTCASLFADAKTLAEMVERSKSSQLVPGPNSLTEPKRVRTMTIRTDGTMQKRIESPTAPNLPTGERSKSTQLTPAPNSPTELSRVHTMTIRTDGAERKRIESPTAPNLLTEERSKSTQLAPGPNSLTEPKRVHTMTIRTDGAERKAPNSLTEP